MSCKAFLARWEQIHNLNQAAAVLNWDQRTYMPPKGAEPRAKQLATLARISHEMFTAKETLDLLAFAEAEGKNFAADSVERAMLRVARRELDKATKVPTSLVVEIAETTSRAE